MAHIPFCRSLGFHHSSFFFVGWRWKSGKELDFDKRHEEKMGHCIRLFTWSVLILLIILKSAGLHGGLAFSGKGAFCVLSFGTTSVLLNKATWLAELHSTCPNRATPCFVVHSVHCGLDKTSCRDFSNIAGLVILGFSPSFSPGLDHQRSSCVTGGYKASSSKVTRFLSAWFVLWKGLWDDFIITDS